MKRDDSLKKRIDAIEDEIATYIDALMICESREESDILKDYLEKLAIKLRMTKGVNDRELRRFYGGLSRSVSKSQ